MIKQKRECFPLKLHLLSVVLTLFFFLSFQILKSLGYNKLVLQIGNGDYEPIACQTQDFTIKYFRLKNSIQDDIHSADLIISHAGTFGSYILSNLVDIILLLIIIIITLEQDLQN